MPNCANPNCRRILRAENRSKDNTSYCRECGDFVWAFRPNSELPDDWYHVSDNTPVAGTTVTGDQCETCGLNIYTIEKDGRWAWVAVCAGQTIEGERRQGCGTRHPVRQKPRKDVIL